MRERERVRHEERERKRERVREGGKGARISTRAFVKEPRNIERKIDTVFSFTYLIFVSRATQTRQREQTKRKKEEVYILYIYRWSRMRRRKVNDKITTRTYILVNTIHDLVITGFYF